MILFILMLFVLLLAVLISWFNFIKDSKALSLPGPFPLPILGNGNYFVGDSTRFLKTLKSLSDEYGGILRFYILNKRYVFLTDSKYIQAITSSNELLTKGYSYLFLHPWLGLGLLTASGQQWKNQRKFLTPAFHFNMLQNFLPVMLKNEKILVNKLRGMADGRDIELFPIIALAALDNVTESIMGVSFNAQTNSESLYVKSINDLGELVSTRMRHPLLGIDAIFNLLPHKKIQDDALKVLHGHSRKVIEARRRDLEDANITSLNYDSDHGIKNRHAFLDLLLLAEVDGKMIDDEKVREEVDTFMFAVWKKSNRYLDFVLSPTDIEKFLKEVPDSQYVATKGHDTTTSGIVFNLYCLAKHPDVQEKILEEQKSILGDDLKRDPTYAEIQEMKYLGLVIKEALRLFAPVPLIERHITQDTEVGGLKIPKNTAVLMDIFHMQRHPNLYKDPLEFKPERAESNLANPFNWLVFSAGPRNCIGQKFAMIEMKVVLSGLIKHFKILPSESEPVLGADLILRSRNGVQIKLASR